MDLEQSGCCLCYFLRVVQFGKDLSIVSLAIRHLSTDANSIGDDELLNFKEKLVGFII